MRVFKCSHCAHHLRYGCRTCSVCYRRTPMVNTNKFWLAMAAVGASLLWAVVLYMDEAFAQKLEVIRPELRSIQAMLV